MRPHPTHFKAPFLVCSPLCGSSYASETDVCSDFTRASPSMVNFYALVVQVVHRALRSRGQGRQNNLRCVAEAAPGPSLGIWDGPG